MGDLLERTRAAVGSDATLTWVDAAPSWRSTDCRRSRYWTEPAGDYGWG